MTKPKKPVRPVGSRTAKKRVSVDIPTVDTVGTGRSAPRLVQLSTNDLAAFRDDMLRQAGRVTAIMDTMARNHIEVVAAIGYRAMAEQMDRVSRCLEYAETDLKARIDMSEINKIRYQRKRL